MRRRRRRESVPWERSDLVSETPIHTHPRYCDTAFMSVPVEHKPTGLVSGSQCPRERSPSAETKRGWLRCHLHHKGKPSLPEPLPVRRIYQRLCTHVTSAFCFFLPISVSPFPILSLWPTPSVHHKPYQQNGSPPPQLSSAETSFLVCTSRFLLVMCSGWCASSSLGTKSH